MIADPIDAAALEARLVPPIGGPVEWLREVGSTNDLLAERATAGAPEGTVIGADHQSAGRGRRGRDWQDNPGADIAMSLLLRPPASRPASLLPLLVAVGVAEGLGRLTDSRVELIWPNDVVVEGRKVCGVLCELASEGDAVRHVVAGVGINVAPPPPIGDARWQPHSLRELGYMGSRQEAVVTVLAEIGRLYSLWRAVGGAGVVSGFGARDALKGRRVEVRAAASADPVVGEAMGIDAEGRLRVRTFAGERAFAAGEVLRIER